MSKREIYLSVAALAMGLAVGIIMMMNRTDPPPPPNAAAHQDTTLLPLIDMARKYTVHLESEIEYLRKRDSIETNSLNKTNAAIQSIEKRRAALPDRSTATDGVIRDYFANLPQR